MKINFLPDSDLEDFSESIREYERIWKEDGSRIIELWEKYSGLQFRESVINAVVFESRSCSHPLSLRFDLPPDRKKSVLVHELGHRILYKRVKGMGNISSIGRHKFLFLLLGDILEELYGKEFLRETIEWESKLPANYDEAWDWASSFSREKRQELFNQILNGDLSIIEN